MAMLRLVKITLLFSLLFFFISSCKAKTNETQRFELPMEEKVYRYPLRYEVDTLDPARALSHSSQIIISQIFDGLVRFDKDLNILPALAESWIISEDGKRYTFFIRRGVRFHNGREVKAGDFVYSFERLLKSKLSPIKNLSLEKRGGFKIEGLRAIDDHTFEIRLKEAYAPTLNLLAMVDAGIVPREETEEGNFGRHPVGTGPFRFKSWIGNEILLEVNNDYYGERPFLKRIIYKIFPGPDDQAIFKDFLDGRLENSLIPWDVDTKTLKARGINIIKRPVAKIHFYGFNTRTSPFNNKLVRQAISYAIDRRRIIKEAVRGRLPLANGLIPPGIIGYTPEIKTHTYAPEKAMKLLREAGYPGGKGFPQIDFWTSSRTRAARIEMDIIRENLSRIGIRIKTHYAPWPELEKKIQRGEMPFFRFTFSPLFPDPEAIFGVLFDSRGVNNYTFYNIPEVDQLIEKGAKELNVLKRVEFYRKAELIILEDAPVIPLLFYTYEQAFQSYVNGIESNSMGAIYIPMNKVFFSKP